MLFVILLSVIYLNLSKSKVIIYEITSKVDDQISVNSLDGAFLLHFLNNFIFYKRGIYITNTKSSRPQFRSLGIKLLRSLKSLRSLPQLFTGHKWKMGHEHSLWNWVSQKVSTIIYHRWNPFLDLFYLIWKTVLFILVEGGKMKNTF